MQDGGAEHALEITVAEAPEGRAQVTVRDTGPGLSEEVLQPLFEPFFTTKPQGLGIGLATSRNIVEVHQGRLRSERVEDQRGGCRFRILLPLDASTTRNETRRER